MVDEPENNVFSIKPKLDPLKPMSPEDWGRELYKTYLISCLGLPELAADHKATLLSDVIAEVFSQATFKCIQNILVLEDEITEATANQLRDETHLKQTAEIIRKELVRQSDLVMWWNEADKELLRGGTPELYLKEALSPFDRFDFVEVAKKVLE